MADTYPNFHTLSQREIPGIDFAIVVRRGRTGCAVVAPHGGGIEPGTSELAHAIAGEDLSSYSFDGLKSDGNSVLHITSTRFDEPMCVQLVTNSDVIVTLHGEGSVAGETVFLGGSDETRGTLIRMALEARGFNVQRHSDPDLQGTEPCNICNRGTSSRGVQLELSVAARRLMFRSLSRDGRKEPTQRFRDFVTALREVLLGDPLRVECDEQR
jgi:phage replication-related protein YjqB (UPF0714/DUF867 family)